MKITIAMGFFLPMPPAMGGATEKTWHRLSQEFSARGHEVTVLSRRWSRWPNHELVGGIRHVRLRSYDHRRHLWQNLLLDLVWSARVLRQMPTADIAVVHAVTLPILLGRLRPHAGAVVVMPGRIPRGQYRRYRRVARVIATSTPVRERVIAENPQLAPITRVYGYPIDCSALARPPRVSAASEVCIGYVGRLHPEKGLDLLVDAALKLGQDATLPPWRLVLCGPTEVAAGGGGESYRAALETKLRAGLPPERWMLRPAVFRTEELAAVYHALDVFCYPSRAEGETFGVAVAEAMAAGSAPIVSNLACFRDFVRPGVSGLVFDHQASDAPTQLAAGLAALVRDTDHRRALAAAALADVQRFDLPRYAETLERDFSALAQARRAAAR